jgi:regulator of sigma E protease
MAYAYGEQYILNSELKDGIWVTNTAIEKAGVKTGDKIVAINGKEITRFDEIAKNLYTAKEVTVDRNGQQQTIQFPINIINQISNSGRKHSLVEVRIPFVISEVNKKSPNYSVLKSKDIITSFNGKPIRYADEAVSQFENFKGQTVPVVIKRGEEMISTTIKFNNESKLGIVYPNKIPYSNIEQLHLYRVNNHEYGFFESIPVGIRIGAETLIGYWDNLKTIFNPKTEAYKEVGGFAAIFNIFPNSWSWEAFWGITALLSIMLGVMNLLPIPALDGGHVMFLLYEMISGRKPSDKFLENAQMVGFLLLIALLLFANGNDIYKAVVGK